MAFSIIRLCFPLSSDNNFPGIFENNGLREHDIGFFFLKQPLCSSIFSASTFSASLSWNRSVEVGRSFSACRKTPTLSEFVSLQKQSWVMRVLERALRIWLWSVLEFSVLSIFYTSEVLAEQDFPPKWQIPDESWSERWDILGDRNKKRHLVTIRFFLEPAPELRISRQLEKTTQQDLLILENEKCDVDPCVLRISGFTAWHMRNLGYSIVWMSQISQLLAFENLGDYIYWCLSCWGEGPVAFLKYR